MPLLTPSDRSAVCGRNASEQVTAFKWNRWPDSVECAPLAREDHSTIRILGNGKIHPARAMVTPQFTFALVAND